MRLFYCPECNKEEIRNDDPYKNEYTINNMRDGYGRPIRHYKCECGNYTNNSNGYVDFVDGVTSMTEAILDKLKYSMKTELN